MIVTKIIIEIEIFVEISHFRVQLIKVLFTKCLSADSAREKTTKNRLYIDLHQIWNILYQLGQYTRRCQRRILEMFENQFPLLQGNSQNN